MSEVVKEIYIQAKPETVYSYFIQPEKLILWMGIEARLEPRKEGQFQVTINTERRILGQYLELEPPSKLLISWGWEGRDDVPPGSSIVEVLFLEYLEGTLVRLRHFNLPEEAMPLHAKSWEHNLPRLKTAVEH